MQIHFEHYRGNEAFVKRIYDQIDQMERQNRTIVTPFFTPEQCAITERICGNHINFIKHGGYLGAERCRFAFSPYEEVCEEVCNVALCVLKATYSSAFGKLSHRDVLGALMHIGIERETFGDLLISDSEVYIICDPNIKNYLICNLTKIKRTSLHFKTGVLDMTYKADIRYEQKIVSSLRLDALVASLAHVSRKKAQTMIIAGYVKVNHVILEQTSYLCNNNSAISIRGYGRFQFQEVLSKTKKDRLVIHVGMYQ